MTAMSEWALTWLASLLIAGAAGAWAWLCVVTPPRVLGQALRTHRDGLERRLGFVRARWTAPQVLGCQLAIVTGLLLVAFVTAAWVVCLLGAVAVLGGPEIVLERATRERVEEIEARLDTWLTLLAHALKTVPALGEALAATAPLVGGALGQELAVALHEHHLGVPLNMALRTMAARVDSPVVSVAATTLEVARRTGGALSDTLERSAASLREMARLQGVVRTKTAEARAQAWVVACVPALVVGLLWKMSPDVIDVLWTTTRGHVVLAIALAMWGAAIASAIKILQVDI